MKLRSIAVAAALLAASSAFAGGALNPGPAVSCTASFNLGSMGPPATKPLGNTFNPGTGFSDCYDFTINAPAHSSGTTTEVSSTFWFFPTYIDVLTVALYTALGTQVDSTDITPGQFSFNNLAAGGYKLVVGGYTTPGWNSSSNTASYTGSMTTSVASVASPVPEGSLAGMVAMAMIGAALVARRSKRG